MTKINIEEWFSSPKRWEKERECLNMEDINKKPYTYEGSLKDWIMEETQILTCDKYLKYCRLNEKERMIYLQRLKGKFSKEIFQTQEEFQVSFETDYDSSDFNNRDIYVDMLNHTYIFL